MNGYCPKCRSRLYPVDSKSMKEFGVCSYCATYDKRYKTKKTKIQKVERKS